MHADRYKPFPYSAGARYSSNSRIWFGRKGIAHIVHQIQHNALEQGSVSDLVARNNVSQQHGAIDIMEILHNAAAVPFYQMDPGKTAKAKIIGKMLLLRQIFFFSIPQLQSSDIPQDQADIP